MKSKGADKLIFDYEFKEFSGKDDILAYVRGPSYNLEDNTPGICFGFSVNYNSKTKYDVNILFDDRSKEDPSGIPSQQSSAYDLY